MKNKVYYLVKYEKSVCGRKYYSIIANKDTKNEIENFIKSFVDAENEIYYKIVVDSQIKWLDHFYTIDDELIFSINE